jgi:hypothetical protein
MLLIGVLLCASAPASREIRAEGRLGSAPRTAQAYPEAGTYAPASPVFVAPHRGVSPGGFSGAGIGPHMLAPAFSAPRCGTSPCVPASFPSDYWIVSSRGCPPCDRGYAANCTACFRRTCDGRVLRTSLDDVIAGLDPARPVSIVIHGSYNYDADVLVESRNMHRWLSRGAGRPVQMIYFTWPSDGYVPILLQLEIAVLGRRSSYHSAYLAHLISRLPSGQPVTLVGHSHGARAAIAATHLLGGGRLENGQVFVYGPQPPRRIRAVLLAAAVDHDWLNPGDRYGRSLCVFERVLLLRNHRDFWLSVYPLRKPFGDQALGRTGLSPCDRGVLGPLGAKVAEFDVTAAIGRGHNMSQYYSRPAIGAAVAPFAEFQDLPTVTPDGWIPLSGTGPTPSVSSDTSTPVRTEYRAPPQAGSVPATPGGSETPALGPTLGPAPTTRRPGLFVAPSRRAAWSSDERPETPSPVPNRTSTSPAATNPAVTNPAVRAPAVTTPRTTPRRGQPTLEFDDGV